MTSGPVSHSTTSAVRGAMLAVALLTILPLTGCRICTSTEDLAYPSYGGAWQRTIRDSGRVGSIFDPAGARASALVSREDPITPDEIERNRRDAESTDEDDPELEDESPDDEPMDDGDGIDGDDSDDVEEKSQEERDAEIEKLKEKLRDQKLDEVKVIPGDPLPPLLR